MKTIYIIKSEYGDYDDKCIWSICATETEGRAIHLVQRFIELNKLNCEVKKLVRDEMRFVWDVAHPAPIAPIKPKPPEGMQELQRRLSERATSPLMLDSLDLKTEYKKLQAQHTENLKPYHAACIQYNEQNKIYLENRKLAEIELFIKNSIVPSYLYEVNTIAQETNHYFNSDNEYSFYQLNVVQ